MSVKEFVCIWHKIMLIYIWNEMSKFIQKMLKFVLIFHKNLQITLRKLKL